MHCWLGSGNSRQSNGTLRSPWVCLEIGLRFTNLLCLCLLFCLVDVVAVGQRPAARIVVPIDETQLITLTGNTHPAANSFNDRGPVLNSLRLTDLILILRRDPAQQAAFDAFVAMQYDPSSPNFHLWLTSAEVAARFGPSPDDVATVSAWLISHGLSVEEVSPDRMSIRFSGTAAQVQAAFHTPIHNLSVNGQPHIANMADPQIPATLGSVILGVKALHNFLPRPAHRAGSLVRYNPVTGQWQRTASGGSAQPAYSVIRPDLGITIGSGTSAYTVEDVAPYDFAAIYNVLPLWNAASPIDGTGQTIAIAGTSDINVADVASFRTVFGLPAGVTPKIVVANGVDPGQCTNTSGVCTIDDLTENTLDVEWSGAVAKGASIVLVVSGQTSPMTDTLYSSSNYVVQNATARILSVSYGECELGMGTAGNAAYNNMWETAVTEGISVFVAAGDAGAATCDQGIAQSFPYTAKDGLTVSGMASTPYDTAVGGTDLNWGTTPAPNWKSSNNSTTGASAAGYIPEIPWNDTCTNPVILPILQQWAQTLQKAGFNAVSPTDAESACNFVSTWYLTIFANTSPVVDISFLVDTVGGGGGMSNCTISDGSTLGSCSGGYAKPSWQAGVSGIPSDSKRDLPDVSFFAGNGLLGSAYLVCVSANGACLTSTSPTTEPVAQEIGGTSVGTPAMAGVMALINQKMAAPQGSPNAELYAIATKQNYTNCKAESVTTSSACSFNDIDTGTIAMPCGAGSPDCNVSRTGDGIGVLSGFAATTAFDPASGLGSLNVANIVNAWTATVGTTPATVTVTPVQNTISIAQSLLVTVKVTGSSGTPTGNATIVGGGYDGGAETLASGAYTFTIPPGSVSPGNYTLTGSYQGDSIYAEGSGTASVTVNKALPKVSVTAAPSSIGANAPVTATISVSGGTGAPAATGTVELTAGTWFAYCSLAAGTCAITIPPNTLPSGSATITVTYPGDVNYEAATGSATETVTALTPTVNVTPPASSVYTDASFQVTVKVAGTGPIPTGTVTIDDLDVNGYSQSIAGQLVNGSYTFTVPPFNINGAGQSVLTMEYTGDTTYVPQSATFIVTAKYTPTTTTDSPSATSIFTNNSLTITGTVGAAVGTPTGGVTIVCGSYTAQAWVNNNGQYSTTIPPGSLSPGNDTVTLTYSGDIYYATSSASFTVAVTQFNRVAPNVAISAPASIGVGEQFLVDVNLSGSDGQPTGTVSVTAGSYTGGAVVINGVADPSIPGNSFAVGNGTITATYSGDATYLAATASTTITVNPSTFTLTAGNPLTVAAGKQGFENITAKTSDGYGGTITLTCALTSQPNGAVNLPTCSGTTISLVGAGANSNNVTISTTAATSSMTRPAFRGLAGFGGAMLAFLVFLAVPARRRDWRNLLGIVILLFAFAGLGACGGGGAGGGGGGGGTPGTTAGTYTFTVTGTGNPVMTPAPTTTFTLTVN